MCRSSKGSTFPSENLSHEVQLIFMDAGAELVTVLDGLLLRDRDVRRSEASQVPTGHPVERLVEDEVAIKDRGLAMRHHEFGIGRVDTVLEADHRATRAQGLNLLQGDRALPEVAWGSVGHGIDADPEGVAVPLVRVLRVPALRWLGRI